MRSFEEWLEATGIDPTYEEKTPMEIAYNAGLREGKEPVAEVLCSEGLEGQTRYKLEYAGHAVSFSATKAATREQLAEVLEEFIEMLKAPEDTGEIGFF